MKRIRHIKNNIYQVNFHDENFEYEAGYRIAGDPDVHGVKLNTTFEEWKKKLKS